MRKALDRLLRSFLQHRMNSNTRILLVDDNEQVVRSLSRMLSRADYDVSTCSDGLSALNLLKSEKEQGTFFSILITDVDMPNLNGFELIQELSNIDEKLAVIVITGSTDLDVIDLLGNRPKTKCIQKPFSIQDIMSLLSGLI